MRKLSFSLSKPLDKLESIKRGGVNAWKTGRKKKVTVQKLEFQVKKKNNQDQSKP